MRRKNRKRTINGFVFPLPFAGIIVISVLTALAYVWLAHCQESLGRELKRLEKQRDFLSKKYVNEESRWMREKSPRNITTALRRHGLVMTWPLRNQVVHLRAPLPRDRSMARLDADLVESPRMGRTIMND